MNIRYDLVQGHTFLYTGPKSVYHVSLVKPWRNDHSVYEDTEASQLINAYHSQVQLPQGRELGGNLLAWPGT